MTWEGAADRVHRHERGGSIDEPAESLGESLRLPPWLEDHGQAIERVLPGARDVTRTTAQ